MYEQIKTLSKQIIHNAYSPNGYDEKLLNDLQHLVTQHIKANDIYPNSDSSLLILNIFNKMKKSNDFAEKFGFLVDEHTYCTKKNPEINVDVFNFIISEYFHAIEDYARNHISTSDNALNILPPEKEKYIYNFYHFAMMNDNVLLHELLESQLAPRNPEEKDISFMDILQIKHYKIFNYMIETISFRHINLIVHRNKTNRLLNIYPENRKNFIAKVCSPKVNIKSRTAIFHTMLHNEFDDSLAEVLTMLLAAKVDINSVDENNWSAVNHAASFKSPKLLEFLINRHPNLNQNTNKLNIAPLHIAMINNLPNNVAILIKAGANMEIVTNKGFTPLLAGIENKSWAAVEMLMTNKPNLENHGKVNFTPLQYAVWNGQEDFVKYFLAHGAKVGTFNKLGNNALQLAAARGFNNIITLLLSHGAKIDDTFIHPTTPLHNAIHNNVFQTIKLLIENGASLQALDNHGRNAILAAAEHCDLHTIEYLLAQGADITATTSDGRNVLHESAKNRNIMVMTYFLSKGFYIDSLSLDGYTPIQIAVINGNLSGYLLLEGLEANVNVRTAEGYTLFHLAVLNETKPILTALAQTNVDINALSYDKKFTAVDLALGNDYIDIFEHLLDLKATFDGTSAGMTNVLKEVSSTQKKKILNYIAKNKPKVERTATQIKEVPVYQQSFPINTATTNYNHDIVRIKTTKPKSHHNKANQFKPIIKAEKQKTASVKTTEKPKINQKTFTNVRQTNSVQPHAQEIDVSLKIMARNQKLMNQSDADKKQKKLEKQQEQSIAISLNSHSFSVGKALTSNSNLTTNFAAISLCQTAIAQVDSDKEVIYANFYSDDFHTIHRSDELDHVGGRPGIIINETNGKFTVLLGTSNPPKAYGNIKYFAVELNPGSGKRCYFYKIRSLDDKKFIKGKWNTPEIVKTELKRQAIDFIPTILLSTLATNIRLNVISLSNLAAQSDNSIMIEENKGERLISKPIAKQSDCENTIASTEVQKDNLLLFS